MKLPLLLSLLLLSISISAQPRAIDIYEYVDGIGDAKKRTNLSYPSVYRETWETFEKGKIVSSVTKLIERESGERQRSTITILEKGKSSTVNKIELGYDKQYCSYDGKTWIGPWMYDCRQPEMPFFKDLDSSTEYSVETTTVNGKQVTVYRMLSVDKGGLFKEDEWVISPFGIYLSMTETRGVAKPRSVSFRKVQSVEPNAKVAAIAAPPNPKPWSPQ